MAGEEREGGKEGRREGAKEISEEERERETRKVIYLCALSMNNRVWIDAS